MNREAREIHPTDCEAAPDFTPHEIALRRTLEAVPVARLRSEPCPVSVETIEDDTGLQSLRDEWNPLLLDSAANTLFLTWEWLHTWWKHLGGGYRLHVLAVRRGARLIALAPLALAPHELRRIIPFRRLGFMGMGTVGSDYLDLILRKGEQEAALNALSDHLARARFALELKRVNTGATATAGLAAKLETSAWRIVEDEADICPRARLRGQSWESYCANLGQSHRRNLRKRLRRLERTFAPSLEEACNENERRNYLRTFTQLHYKRWNGPRGSEAINTEALVGFHDELSRLALERGWLRLYVLRLGDRPAAAVYGFRYGDVFYYYQAGFDPAFQSYSIGLATLGLTIRRALDRGVAEFDLLHGAERYKFLWADDERKLTTFNCYPPTLTGWMARSAEGIRDGAKSLRDWTTRARRP